MIKSLAKSAIFNVIYQGLNVVFPLISATYVAKVLSPSGVGSVAYVQNIVSYFMMIAMLGMPTYGTREIAQCRDNPLQTNTLFSELLLLNTISTGICLVSYGMFVLLFVRPNYLLYMICGAELLFNFINVDWFYRGNEDFVYIAVRSVCVKIVSLIFLFQFVKDTNDCAVYALIVCFANGVNYLFNIVNLRKKVKLTFTNLNLRKHIKPLLVLLFCSVAAGLYSKMDITMLGVICGDREVGLYSTAFKMIGIVIGLVASATSVFLPRISYYYAADQILFTEYVTRALKLVCFISIPAAVGVMLVSGELMVVLFGTEFTAAASALKILSPLLIIRGVGDVMCYQVLVSAGKERYFLFSYILAAAANIILNSILIPRMQHDGAAIASVFSEFVVNSILLHYALQIVKPEFGKKYLYSVCYSTLAMFFSVILVQKILVVPVTKLLTSVSSGCVVYFAVNAVLGNEIVSFLIKKVFSMIKDKCSRQS